MKNVVLRVVMVAVLLVSLVLTGCKAVSGGGVITEKKDLTNFTSLEIGSAFDFKVSYSDSWSVTISADEDLFDYIEVTHIGNTLKILLNPRHIFTDFTLGSHTLKADITMPVLSGLTVTGACSGEVKGFSSSSNMVLNVSGASKVKLDGLKAGGISGEIAGASTASGNVTATSIAMEVSGASKMEFAGSTTNLDIIVSGASTADLESFRAVNVDANISGASKATVWVESSLDVFVSGASSLFFVGNPTLGQSSVSGASTIKHKE